MKKRRKMIIAIPVDKNEENTTVCMSFGRAPYFMFVDSESGRSEFAENDAAESQGGAGIKAAQFIVDHKANVLLTPRCGENAAEVIQAAGIIVYRTNGNSGKENIAALKDHKLTLLEEFHAGFHGHRSNS
jgi:predicted Fe-Mo cluster-binding NifX family protein